MIVWLAVESAEVDNIAVPPDRDCVPRDVAPSKNSTEPLNVPAPGEVIATVAVNVTDWP